MYSNIKKGIAFTENPINLCSDVSIAEAEYNPVTGIPFTVSAPGMKQRYTGRYNQPFDVNVSEIVNPYAEYIGEPRSGAPTVNGVIEIEDLIDLERRRIYVCITDDDIDEWNCLIFPGGISRQNYRILTSLGTDIFENRFLNNAGNFFMTTRTAGWRIVLKETELYPMYFFNMDDSLYMTVVELTTGKTMMQEGQLKKGVFALDIDAVRKCFFEEYGVLSSVFDIYKGNPSEYSCRIVIERSEPTRERYRLKFRNSLGVFEIIELNGELTISPDYSAADDAGFNRYDAVTDGFSTYRERIIRPQSLTVDTFVSHTDAVRFFMDMIGSEEVFLLDLTEYPLRVIPSIEDMNYKARPTEPQTFTVTLRIAEDESNIMQDIIDGNEGRKPRVFSKQFSKQFN